MLVSVRPNPIPSHILDKNIEPTYCNFLNLSNEDNQGPLKEIQEFFLWIATSVCNIGQAIPRPQSWLHCQTNYMFLFWRSVKKLDNLSSQYLCWSQPLAWKINIVSFRTRMEGIDNKRLKSGVHIQWRCR